MFHKILGVLALCGLGAYADSAPLKARLEEALRQRNVPRSAQWWTEQGAEVPGLLVQIYQENKGIRSRISAIEALRFFSDADTAVFLKKEALGASNLSVRRLALRSIALSQGLKEKAFFQEVFKDPNPQIRCAAAEALIQLKTEEANALVTEYLANETVPWIHTRLDPPKRRGLHRQAVRRATPPGLDPRM